MRARIPSENAIQIQVRDAVEADISVLTSIKGTGTEVIHHDRLRDAQHIHFRYLVLEVDQRVIGFACLVSRRPSYWSDANDEEHLPQIVDLQIAEAHRGRGYGSAFVRLLEKIAAEAGHRQLYLGVDPIDNPRAYALYVRLGYQPLQEKPYRKAWEFTDSEGHDHRGEDWIIDLAKPLSISV